MKRNRFVVQRGISYDWTVLDKKEHATVAAFARGAHSKNDARRYADDLNDMWILANYDVDAFARQIHE